MRRAWGAAIALMLGLTGGLTLTGWPGPVAAQLATGQVAPELAAGAWINSPPLSMQGLRGRVVLVDFWTYG